jgi:preprotein translocase subunit YajC
MQCITTVAQAQPGGQPPADPGFLGIFRGFPGLMLMLVIVLWIFVFSSKRKEAKARKERMATIKRGDRVQTIGGIIGKVVETEDARILVKVDETSNTKIWFVREAIQKVLGEEKAGEAPAKQ